MYSAFFDGPDSNLLRVRKNIHTHSGTSRSAIVFTSILAGGMCYTQKKRLRVQKMQRQANVTGPGWTDELARIFDPREEGPAWQAEFGYSGRPRLRMILDAEDICLSYANAKWKQTGKWTGPLSEGIEKALDYGAWGGGEIEPVNPNRKPDEPDMTPPEILTFIGMPADMIEAVRPGHLVDGYPEALREELGHVVLNDEGYFINTFLQSLQEDNRLITWSRPRRWPGGNYRDNTLQAQKNYEATCLCYALLIRFQFFFFFFNLKASLLGMMCY